MKKRYVVCRDRTAVFDSLPLAWLFRLCKLLCAVPRRSTPPCVPVFLPSVVFARPFPHFKQLASIFNCLAPHSPRAACIT